MRQFVFLSFVQSICSLRRLPRCKNSATKTGEQITVSQPKDLEGAFVNSFGALTFFVHFYSGADLPSDAPQGTFTEQFVVTDKQANTTLNHVANFEVRG